VDVAGRIREDLHLVMDWEYWLRIALLGKVIRYFPVHLANFRIWDQAKTSSYAERSAQEKILVLDQYFGQEEFLPQIKGFRKKAYSNVHRFASWAYRRNDLSLVHLLKAIKYRPSLLKEKGVVKTFFKMLAVLLIGKRLNKKRRDLSAFFSKIMGMTK
jgi:hypothetical protein